MADSALNVALGPTGPTGSTGAIEDGQLSDLELRILEFERQWWQYAGAKESSIRELFQIPPSRYYEILNHLIDREEALVAAPMLVKRLRRMREARLAERHSQR